MPARIRGMNEREPENFEDVVRRLRDHREELTPLELDALKTRAKRRATRRSGANARPRLVVALATLGLMAGGTGAVIAQPGKSLERPPESAAGNQYKGYGPCKQGSGKTGPPGRPGSNCQTDPPPPTKP